MLIVYFQNLVAFGDFFYQGISLVVELVLSILAFGIEQMKVIVVAACENAAAIGRCRNEEVVVDGLVLGHLTQLCLQTIVQIDNADWFFGIADVPDFDCEVVTRYYVSA